MRNKNYRIASPLFLWGLAVSAVIVGEFAGWNAGLIEGGFGGMLAATIIVTVMFGCLAATFSELATAIPYCGGTYVYSRAAFSPTVSFLAAVSQLMEYVCTLATVLAGIEISTRNLFQRTFDIHVPSLAIWTVVIVVFALLNIWDSRVFYRSALILSIASLGSLVFFCIKAVPFFDIQLLLNVPFVEGGTKWLPQGIIGVAWCLPFAIWLYVVLEIITLAPEDTLNAASAIPKAFYAAFMTIFLFSVLVLFLVPGVGLGAVDVAAHNNPLRIALKAITANQLPAVLLFLLIITGPLAGYHSTVFAAAKVVFSLGRSGYLPDKFSTMSDKRQTPHVAIIFVSVAVLLILIGINLFTDPRSSVPILLNMSILGAVASYSFSFLAYIKLKVKHPLMKRPYQSPLGVTGAVAGLIITTVTSLLMFTNEDYITALSFCLFMYVLGMLYFYIFRKGKIVADAPEETFAKHLESHSTAE